MFVMQTLLLPPQKLCQVDGDKCAWGLGPVVPLVQGEQDSSYHQGNRASEVFTVHAG